MNTEQKSFTESSTMPWRRQISFGTTPRIHHPQKQAFLSKQLYSNCTMGDRQQKRAYWSWSNWKRGSRCRWRCGYSCRCGRLNRSWRRNRCRRRPRCHLYRGRGSNSNRNRQKWCIPSCCWRRWRNPCRCCIHMKCSSCRNLGIVQPLHIWQESTTYSVYFFLLPTLNTASRESIMIAIKLTWISIFTLSKLPKVQV